MAQQRLELALDVLGDVDDIGDGRVGRQPHLADGPRLVAFLQQFRKREGVARIGVDGAERGFAGSQVVGVAGEDAIEGAVGRLAQHHLRPHLADDPADVAAQRPVGDGAPGAGTGMNAMSCVPSSPPERLGTNAPISCPVDASMRTTLSLPKLLA